MIIIGVDPGKKTGIFALESETGARLWSTEISAFAAVSYVDDYISLHSNVLLAVERYTIGSLKMTVQYDALEVIGTLRYLARKKSHRFQLQSRAEKSRIPNDVLKSIGFYVPGFDDANDAARHAFIAFARLYPEHNTVKRVFDRIEERGGSE